jgi:hypothetical protein
MADLRQTLAELPGLTLEQLRTQWRRHFGAPPAIRSRDLLCRAFAERLQMEAFGGDPAYDQRIRAELARLRPGRKPAVNRPRYRPGAVLEKAWQGTRHHVEVLPDGYRWEERTFASLSAVARAITGARWNGPRFFGLRTSGKAE